MGRKLCFTLNPKRKDNSIKQLTLENLDQRIRCLEIRFDELFGVGKNDKNR